MSEAKPVCVQLKCISGPHIGQKFRLEAVGVSLSTYRVEGTLGLSRNLNMQIEEEDIFKIGRSTGKLFKEKGVSIYKDKEVSTTHAKVSLLLFI